MNAETTVEVVLTLPPDWSKRSLRSGQLIDRWLKVQANLFTPNLPKETRNRIQGILSRIEKAHDQVTPWPNLKLGTGSLF